MEMRLHLQKRGDRVGLVDAAGPAPEDIDLLKRDDIGLSFSDDGSDAAGIELPVTADATVDVIGQESD